MAETRKQYTEQQYYAQHQSDSGNIPSDFKGLGYYSRTSLEDIINNFMVQLLGEVNPRLCDGSMMRWLKVIS